MFAIVTTGHILIAIQLEERDLIAQLGVDYEDYRKRVPMLVPRLFQRLEYGDTVAGHAPRYTQPLTDELEGGMLMAVLAWRVRLRVFSGRVAMLGSTMLA